MRSMRRPMSDLRRFGLIELSPAGHTPDLCPSGIGVLGAVAFALRLTATASVMVLFPRVLSDAVAGIPASQVRKVACWSSVLSQPIFHSAFGSTMYVSYRSGRGVTNLAAARTIRCECPCPSCSAYP